MSSFNNQIKAGWAAYNKRDFSTAIELFEKALLESGDSLHILGHIAYCYNKKDVLDRSIQYCERALKIDPKYFFAFEILSEVYAKKCDNSKAYYYIHKAMKNRPTIPKLPNFINRIIKSLRLEKTKISLLNNIWNEPEDAEWLKWAQQFKASYEI